jgi:hypothetical protein
VSVFAAMRGNGRSMDKQARACAYAMVDITVPVTRTHHTPSLSTSTTLLMLCTAISNSRCSMRITTNVAFADSCLRHRCLASGGGAAVGPARPLPRRKSDAICDDWYAASARTGRGTKLIIRGDSGRPEVMAWRETNDIEYIFGLSGNAVLQRLV